MKKDSEGEDPLVTYSGATSKHGDIEEFSMRSDHPSIRKVAEAMQAAGNAALAELELQPPFNHITLAMAMAAMVWESGQRHERIPTSTIRLLLNMAVDNGLAEQVGMVQMPGEGEKLN